MFDSMQVCIGRGRQDPGALHRAIAVAQELHAAGKWDGLGRLIVHEADQLLRTLQLSGRHHFDCKVVCTVHNAIDTLEEGKDYEVQILSTVMCQNLGIDPARALEEAP